jgi:hypothetical protein
VLIGAQTAVKRRRKTAVQASRPTSARAREGTRERGGEEQWCLGVVLTVYRSWRSVWERRQWVVMGGVMALMPLLVGAGFRGVKEVF